MTDSAIKEIASLHNEIFELSAENERLMLKLIMIQQAANDLISNDVGNLRWLEAEKLVKNFNK